MHIFKEEVDNPNLILQKGKVNKQEAKFNQQKEDVLDYVYKGRELLREALEKKVKDVLHYVQVGKERQLNEVYERKEEALRSEDSEPEHE